MPPPRSPSANDAAPTLHSRLPATAPLPASILSRSAASDGSPSYTLLMGEVPIPSVSLDEIFDYISPHDLERFENQAFEREKALGEARELQRLEARRKTRQLRWAQRNAGVAADEGTSDDGSESEMLSFWGVKHARGEQETTASSGNDGSGTTTARGGRPRPNYSHFYPKERVKKRRDESVEASLPPPPPKKRASPVVRVHVNGQVNSPARPPPVSRTVSSTAETGPGPSKRTKLGSPSLSPPLRPLSQFIDKASFRAGSGVKNTTTPRGYMEGYDVIELVSSASPSSSSSSP